jgi:hypothetical protein
MKIPSSHKLKLFTGKEELANSASRDREKPSTMQAVDKQTKAQPIFDLQKLKDQLATRKHAHPKVLPLKMKH